MLTFLKSRPTESWLILWTAIVGVLQASGVEISETLVAAISALIGALITLFASRPSNEFGPSSAGD